MNKHREILIVPFCAAVSVIAYFGYKYFVYKQKSFMIDKCIIIETLAGWKFHEKEILNNFKRNKVIAIDCEWVTENGVRKPISLLQLANSSGFCVLIRLSVLKLRTIPSTLEDLLKSDDIVKVGVAVNEDGEKLFCDYGITVRNYLDLRYLAEVFPSMQGKSLGLKSLAYEFLGNNINKSNWLRCSNWDAPVLSEEQISYAVTDAVIAAQIFIEMKVQLMSSFRFWNRNKFFYEAIQKYLDLPYKVSKSNGEEKIVHKSISIKHFKKDKFTQPRSKPMYDNYQIVAPDGEILCGCDSKKADWYLNKGLGEKMPDNPFIVRLNFEPSGRPLFDNIFYTQEKLNLCVVCGATDNFLCKSVVPSEYRKHFPGIMKRNLSHDILLLCIDCHKECNKKDALMYKKLAELCDAPIGNEKYFNQITNPLLCKVKSAARALTKPSNKLPKYRQEELRKIISDYFNVNTFTQEILNLALDLNVNLPTKSFIPHGLKVYQYFCQNEGLIKLERLWRQHFLDSMQPKYMPSMWSVNHNHQRLALQIINKEREIDFDANILGITDDLLKGIEQPKAK